MLPTVSGRTCRATATFVSEKKVGRQREVKSHHHWFIPSQAQVKRLHTRKSQLTPRVVHKKRSDLCTPHTHRCPTPHGPSQAQVKNASDRIATVGRTCSPATFSPALTPTTHGNMAHSLRIQHLAGLGARTKSQCVSPPGFLRLATASASSQFKSAVTSQTDSLQRTSPGNKGQCAQQNDHH